MAMSVRNHVHRDNSQNTSSHQSCSGDEQFRQVCADGSKRRQHIVPKLAIARPTADHRSAADDERCKRHRYEEDSKAKVRAGAEPFNYAPGGFRGLIRRRLNIPREERGHEQRGRKHQEQLQDGKGMLYSFHEYSVMQSDIRVKPLTLCNVARRPADEDSDGHQPAVTSDRSPELNRWFPFVAPSF
jgi:hypothetical protein